MCEDVIYNGGYQIWNQNSNTKIPNQSSYFLFNLEDEGSNPAGLTKSSNNEFILYGVYDYILRQGGVNLSHTVASMIPSRKFVDMFLCTDGLPIKYSDLFQGYHNTGDEYKNRDYRLMNYTNQELILNLDRLFWIEDWQDIIVLNFILIIIRHIEKRKRSQPIIRCYVWLKCS